VLLILAVVAIGAVNNDGIIGHAKDAKNKYQTAQGNEKTELEGYEEKINSANEDDKPIVHEGVIPEGGKYISADGTEYNAGDNFPEVTEFDKYRYGDYEYCYSWGWCSSDLCWPDNENLCGCYETPTNGWAVRCISNIATPSEVITRINGEPITSMTGAYCKLSELESISGFVIPNSVTDLSSTFNGCTSLTGTITINANPTSYNYCFNNVDMSKMTLAGACPAAETVDS